MVLFYRNQSQSDELQILFPERHLIYLCITHIAHLLLEKSFFLKNEATNTFYGFIGAYRQITIDILTFNLHQENENQ